MPIVKELRLQNFYNYSNEVVYEFKEGINIVVADNNGGKSKLYNAFLWILKNEVFDSDLRTYTGLIEPKNQFKLISDKAKNEAVVGDEIATTVTLIFENDLSMSKSEAGAATYTVIKTIKAKKIKEGSPFLYDNWRVSLDEPVITCQRGYDTKQLNDKKAHETIADRLLPYALQNYYMFQGEEISQLVGTELTSAIGKITGIKKFDYFENYLSDILTKSRNAFNKATKNIVTNSKAAEELSASIERTEKTVIEHSKRIKELNGHCAIVDQQYSSLHGQYTEALTQNKIIKEISQIDEKIRRAKLDLETIEINYNSHFFKDKWLLYGLKPFKDQFLKLRQEYNERRAEKFAETFVSQLPLNMPDVPSLDQMIRDMHCHVCNRSMSEHDQAFIHLKKLRDRNNDENKTQDTKIISFIDLLHQHSGNIPESDIIDQSEQRLKEKLRSLNEEIESLTERKELLKAKQNNEKEAVMKLLNDYNACRNLRDKIRDELQREQIKKDRAQEMCQTNLAKQNKLPGMDKINPGYKRKSEILENILEAFSEAKTQYYNDQANFLKSVANKDYEDLTLGNQTAPGSIDISVSSNFQFTSDLKNNEGGLLSGQGTAFQRMKQLSLLLGIVKLGNSNEYPLIADAPVSELSSILTKNFFYTVPKNFKQSILMVKDLIDESSAGQKDICLNSLGDEIKKDKYLDPRIYINNAKGKDQHQRETIVELIKE